MPELAEYPFGSTFWRNLLPHVPVASMNNCYCGHKDDDHFAQSPEVCLIEDCGCGRYDPDDPDLDPEEGIGKVAGAVDEERLRFHHVGIF